MKTTKAAKELLERYLLGVKRELIGKEREDITAEIESYLYDLLAERFTEEQEIGEQEMEAVLKEMGSPRKVAARYRPQRALIGARIFPIYTLVLRIVVAVVIGGMTLAFIISSIVGQPAGAGLHVWEWLGSIGSGALSAFGMVTIVFAIIERTNEKRALDEIEDMNTLDIADLPQLPEEQKEVKRVGKALEILLGIVGLAFFTYMRSTAGFVPYRTNLSEQAHMVPFFSDSFVKMIPFILALTAVDLARNITLFVQRQHTALTSWWHILSESANVVLLGFLISSLPMFTLDILNEFMDAESVLTIQSITNIGMAIALGLGIVGGVSDIIKGIIRERKQPTI